MLISRVLHRDETVVHGGGSVGLLLGFEKKGTLHVTTVVSVFVRNEIQGAMAIGNTQGDDFPMQPVCDSSRPSPRVWENGASHFGKPRNRTVRFLLLSRLCVLLRKPLPESLRRHDSGLRCSPIGLSNTKGKTVLGTHTKGLVLSFERLCTCAGGWLPIWTDTWRCANLTILPGARRKKERERKKKSSPPLAARTSLQRLHTEVAAS